MSQILVALALLLSAVGSAQEAVAADIAPRSWHPKSTELAESGKAGLEGAWRVILWLVPSEGWGPPLAFWFDLRTYVGAGDELLHAGKFCMSALEYGARDLPECAPDSNELVILSTLRQKEGEIWEWMPAFPALSKGLELPLIEGLDGDWLDVSALTSGQDPRLPGFKVGTYHRVRLHRPVRLRREASTGAPLFKYGKVAWEDKVTAEVDSALVSATGCQRTAQAYGPPVFENADYRVFTWSREYRVWSIRFKIGERQ